MHSKKYLQIFKAWFVKIKTYDTKMGEYQENSDFEDLLDTDSDDDDEGKKDNDKDSDDNLLR